LQQLTLPPLLLLLLLLLLLPVLPRAYLLAVGRTQEKVSSMGM